MNAPARTGASLNRHRSNTVVSTPWELVHAVEWLTGKRFATDLAATSDNAKAGLALTANSLDVDWDLYPGPAWLNPPYDNIAPWAEKCAGSMLEIAFLVPASVGSNWFARWVLPHARVYALRPRVKFEGHTQCYPKDLIVAHYRSPKGPGFETWKWK